MGMFDSFMLEVRCPYCDEKSIIEFQTKDFQCMLNVWKEGQRFTGMDMEKGTIKNVYGGCSSPICKEFCKKRDGYWSGCGRCFYCDVVIEYHNVLRAINIRTEEGDEE